MVSSYDLNVDRPQEVAIVLETVANHYLKYKQWPGLSNILQKAAIQCHKITGSICEECDVISDDIVTDDLGRLICRDCAKRLGYGYCKDCNKWALLECDSYCNECVDA